MKQNSFLYFTIALLLGGSLFLSSCSDDTPNSPDKEGTKRVTTDEQYYANQFARSVMEYNYVWNEEIASDLAKLDPNMNVKPIETVREIRYHQGDKEIDKWTKLYPNIQKFEDSSAGISTTYGYQPITYVLDEGKDDCFSAIAFVFPNSPAERAGLKRGDLIYKINGKKLTTKNFKGLFDSSTVTISLAKLKGSVIEPTGKEVTMNAVEMYENPILLDSIYEVNGKKVGYLAYTNFDLVSIPSLIDISKKFKAEGVKELILDFRYNGGGYVITENVMASLYAPQSVVDAKALFEKEKYNKRITREFEKEGISTKSFLNTEFVFKDQNNKKFFYSTKDANIGIEKVYGLVTKNTASASEALLGGLMPFYDVDIIGEQTHGKYCTGWSISAKDVYKKVPKSIADYGIYLMVAIYQNSKGETPCMPDGIQPDFKVSDSPVLPEQLGDVNERMLKAALMRAGKVYDESEVESRSSFDTKFLEYHTPHKANFGMRILLPKKMPFSIE